MTWGRLTPPPPSNSRVAKYPSKCRVNVRGLRQNVKRRTLFHFLHTEYPSHIAILQEIHSKPRDISYWRAEWGADIFCAHGPSTNERRVAVLMPRRFGGKVTQLYDDSEDRMLIIDVEFQAVKLSLFALYATTQGQAEDQIRFF